MELDVIRLSRRMDRLEVDNQLLCDALDQSPCLVCQMQVSKTGSRKIIFATGGLLATLGLTEASLKADPRQYETIIHPEDRHFLLEKRLELARTGEPTSVQMRFGASNGDYRWLRVKMTPCNISGDTLLYNLIAIDVTDEMETKLHEEDLQQQHFMSEKMDALGRLSSGIAHDFNNMLAIFSNTIDLAIQELPKGHRVRQYLRDSLRVCERGKNLIDQILLFSKADDSPDHPVRLDSVIDDATLFLKRLLPSTIKLTTNVQERQAVVRANSTKLFQVILNLCVNAQHAIGDRKGTISISLEKVSGFSDRRRQAPAGSQYFRLTIQDDGRGMSSEVRAKIFAPFFTTKGPEGGTGLGLAVVQRIVEQAQGLIDVKSELGKGTSFSIYLPVCGQEYTEEVPSPNDAQIKGHGHVLLIEDDLILKATTTRQIERHGFSVTATSSAEEAIDLVSRKQTKFDVVLTDFGLPGMDGVSCARSLRAMDPDVRILIYSGYAENEAILVAQEEGTIMDSISKPFTSAELANKLALAVA